MIKVLMNNLVIVSIFAGFYGSENAFACTRGEIKTTSIGAKFKCVAEPSPAGWADSWQDPNGVAWGSTLAGKFDNLGFYNGDNIITSRAVEACRHMGGELPSSADYQNLLHFFPTNSEERKKDLYVIFKDMGSASFWTDILANSYDSAFAFAGDGGFLFIDDRSNSYSVRCVRRCPLPLSPGCSM